MKIYFCVSDIFQFLLIELKDSILSHPMEIKFANAPIEQQYKSWQSQIGETDPYVGLNTVGIHDVLRAHFLLQDFFCDLGEGVGGIGPRGLNLLHSAMTRQTTGFSGKLKWSDPLDICSTLFFGLIKNHPFHDCNKRTALLILLFHLEKIGRIPDRSQKDFEDLAVRVAESGLEDYSQFEKFHRDRHDQEIKFVSHFIKKSTRKTDNKYYVITYAQLRDILERLGFEIEEPDNDCIRVVKDVEEKWLLGLRRKKVKKTFITLPFHTWKSEVGRRSISRIRRACNLGSENGVDSEVFFRGRDPMSTFIQTFEGPLRRLSNR